MFFPIPFVEYHPTVSGMDVIESEVRKKLISSAASFQVPSDPQEAREKALNRLRDDHPPKRKRQLIVQKVSRFNYFHTSIFRIMVDLIHSTSPVLVYMDPITSHSEIDSMANAQI